MPRVLVVEDNAEAQSLIAAILGPIGYAVQGAMGGAQGLVLAEADPPDLVLLDLQMPGMDGYEVCRILRRGTKTRHIPIIMVTVSDDPALHRKAYALGAQACFPKPIRQGALISTIQVVLAGTVRKKDTK
jgi:CheY-like chemotaxis protein